MVIVTKNLKKFPDNYFDAVVTDPPYGLGNEPNAEQMLSAWISVGFLEVNGTGFMGKKWDAFVPQPNFWKEVYRVLKHGGHVVAFFGTRTYDWGVMAMRLGGFEIRDCIQWLYGSGFPKSYNVAKGIEGKIINGSSSWNEWKKLDGEKEKLNWGYSKSQAEQGYRGDYTEANKERVGKVNFQSEQAKQWNGWGSALKPANEPIVLARKPLEKGLSIAENVLKWGTGGINIDACRVGVENRTYKGMSLEKPSGAGTFRDDNWQPKEIEVNVSGRFPANLILTHHPECECVGLKKVGNGKEVGYNYKGNVYDVDGFVPNNSPEANSNYGQETIEDWTCHDDCPIKIMDEQSGLVGGDKRISKSTYDKGIWGNAKPIESKALYNDEGSASRFFYVAKASKSERNFGLEEFEEKQTIGGGGTYNEEAGAKYGSIKAVAKNFHPTVKPVKLMQYLVRMITPPNGKVLDPFNGSGTTGIACSLENIEYTGIELYADYCKISEARINNWSELNEYEQYKLMNEMEETNPKYGIQTKLF
ncbi:MAG: site-specific DNA-methyltransferase [Alphaproteobacteria bacterium]|nr:site-specific DNA-methyltransferase [Alphaproteobacteria bacterium]